MRAVVARQTRSEERLSESKHWPGFRRRYIFVINRSLRGLRRACWRRWPKAHLPEQIAIMKNTIALLASATATLLLASPQPALAQNERAKAHPTGTSTHAVAVLQPTKGSQVKGTITFTKTQEGVRVQGEVTGLTPGKHGFHVHEYGDLTSPDGKSAGDHFNPAGHPHAAPGAGPHHAGDLGNIVAGENGTAKVDMLAKELAFEGAASILGRGLVVHAKADDLKSQPSGDAGDRVAVGVIGVAKSK